MGFGIVFIGYAIAFLMTLNSFGFLFRLVGTAVMLYGIRKLCDFEIRFKIVYAGTILLAVISCCESLSTLLTDYSSFVITWIPENLKNIFYAAFMAISAVLHLLFYRAVRKLSQDVGDNKIYGRTIRCEIYVCVEILLALVTLITFWLRVSIVNPLFAAAFIVLYILVFLNLILLYTCYKNICEEGDEEAPRKASRIPFMEKLLSASEKKEAEIYAKTKEYAENKLRSENAAKANKKKKRKK